VDGVVASANAGISNSYIRQDHTHNYYLDRSQILGNKYYHQVQGQLYITGTRSCDLCVWSEKSTIKLVKEKDEQWSRNISALENFYATVFLPE
jgi:hypothetical protein